MHRVSQEVCSDRWRRTLLKDVVPGRITWLHSILILDWLDWTFVVHVWSTKSDIPQDTKKKYAVVVSKQLLACVQFFLSHPVVLLSFINRFALARQQIDSNTTGSQKKLVEHTALDRDASWINLAIEAAIQEFEEVVVYFSLFSRNWTFFFTSCIVCTRTDTKTQQQV